MEPRFANRVVLVTGAGAGIGRASALAFAREGATVVVSDIEEPAGEETLRQIRDAGGNGMFVRADVADAAQVQQLVQRTLDGYGRLDCAHNNAGIPGLRARTADRELDDWQRTIAVNLTGTWLCMKHEIPPMLRQGRGAIVNTASVAGVVGVRRFSAYSASKHGVVGLTKSAALEYSRFGVRINAVCPGIVDTDLLRAVRLGAGKPRGFAGLVEPLVHAVSRAVLASKQPAKRLGQVGEIAEAVLWLCSDGASFVNGHALVVDGGFTAK